MPATLFAVVGPAAAARATTAGNATGVTRSGDTFTVAIDAADRSGTLWIKAGNHAVTGAFTVTATGLTLPAGTPVTPAAPNWKVVSVGSQETAAENGAATNAIDGNSATIWHTQWSTTATPLPHEIQLDLCARYSVDSLTCLPRQDGSVNGRIGGYEIYVSDSTANWGTPVAAGTFADTAAARTVNFTPKNGRYVRLRALGEAGNRGPWTSVAEITATGTPVP
ncbi:discoidin domain-containing protein [Kitasatospora griseola]|uniref:discoidin domain-containing protein n=1 Tax=Kitasatospora griseola TaxID=2064 RepID=UPI0038557AFF